MSGLIALDEVSSTNDYLKQRIGELPDGAAVTARVQTAGRGRRGHTWAADDGMLPLSVLLKNPVGIETLTLRAGCAVCGALEALSPEKTDIAIKWPNDILISRRKVCGILCESARFGDNIAVICGIGVNLTQSDSFFSENGIPHGGSIKALTGISPDRTALAEDIVRRVRALAAVSFDDVREEYAKRCVTLGKQVRICENGAERTALAVDIAENGFLVCRGEGGFFEVNSGEVSVRGLMGYV